MSASTEPAIAVEGLNVIRGGNHVLHALDFTVERGRITGVLGEAAGSYDVRSSAGYVTQAPAVYMDLTARENLRYFARVLGAPVTRIDEVLQTVQLGRHADRPVRNLSGGQRARVSLGTALLGEPDVLVLDEPTVGLDPQMRREVQDHIQAMKDHGRAVLLATHDM